MGQFRDYLNEARNKQVPTEFRIALGQLKRMYNAGEVPEKKELEKDVEMIAKKNHLDSDKFLEFVIAEFKLNEAKLSKSEYKDKKEELINLLWKYDNGKGFDKKEDIYKQYKMEIDTIMLGKVKLERALELLGFNSKEIGKNDKNIKAIKDFLSDNLNESAVGTPGRTTVADAEEHIDDELVAEFKKIIKKLGGKTVAKVLLDKLGAKPEIKDEIEHIEDIIDNSNY